MSINFKSVPSGALRAGRAGQTESSRRKRASVPCPSFSPSLLALSLSLSLSSSLSLSPCSSRFLLSSPFLVLSSFFLSFSSSSFLYPPPATSFPSSSSPPIYAIPGSYGDSGLAVNCVWCNPRGFYNRDFHPFFLPPGLSTGRPSTPFSPPSSFSTRRFSSSSSSFASLTARLHALPPAFHSFSSSSSSVFLTPVLLLSRRLIVRDWFSNRFLAAPFFAD